MVKLILYSVTKFIKKLFYRIDWLSGKLCNSLSEGANGILKTIIYC